MNLEKISIPAYEFDEKSKENTTNPFEEDIKFKSINLNDEVFEQLQDLHFNSIPLKITQILKELKQEKEVIFQNV